MIIPVSLVFVYIISTNTNNVKTITKLYCFYVFIYYQVQYNRKMLSFPIILCVLGNTILLTTSTRELNLFILLYRIVVSNTI